MCPVMPGPQQRPVPVRHGGDPGPESAPRASWYANPSLDGSGAPQLPSALPPSEPRWHLARALSWWAAGLCLTLVGWSALLLVDKSAARWAFVMVVGAVLAAAALTVVIVMVNVRHGAPRAWRTWMWWCFGATTLTVSLSMVAAVLDVGYCATTVVFSEGGIHC